ncbi:MAG: hypothetical protein KDK34_05765 [Leptospiraceae bacterium]|nr:hypothetical protein [Leptospiraceae bacterium]
MSEHKKRTIQDMERAIPRYLPRFMLIVIVSGILTLLVLATINWKNMYLADWIGLNLEKVAIRWKMEE